MTYVKLLKKILLTFFLTALVISCGEKTNNPEDVTEELQAWPLPGLENDEWIMGGKAFGIFHEVKDYNVWKPVFDSDEPRRAQAGFQFLDILSSTDNSNNLAVFFRTPDHRAAKDFISDGLRMKMNEAGVVSVPSFIMYDIVIMTNNNYDSIPYRVGMSYKVKNFKSWLEKFNSDRATRKNSGLLDIAVARSPESPRMVYIMMATNNLEEAKAFMATEAAAEKMSYYNVIGEPTFSFWKRAELN